MYIFIDESGTGSKVGHATIAVVYLEVTNQNKFDNGYTKILKELRLNSFHWAEHGWKVRQKYINKILNLDFIYKVALFENPININDMYDLVFQQLITEPNIKNIYIDGKKKKWYERKLKMILRDKDIKISKLKSVRKEDSYGGLQLADSIAGLTRYHIDNLNSPDASILIKRLKKRNKLFIEYKFQNIKNPALKRGQLSK